MEDNKILNVLNDFLEKCNELKKSFASEINTQQESLQILGILSQIKIFMSNSFGMDSEYYKIIAYTAATYDRIILDKIIVGLENIITSLSFKFIPQVGSAYESSNRGLEYFEKRSDEIIFAQFPGQPAPQPYQRIFEHGEKVPWDYSATGAKWDPSYELYMSRSIYGTPINTIHKGGYTYIDQEKVNAPIVSKYISDFSKGKFNRPTSYGEWGVVSQLPRGGQAAVFIVKRENDDVEYVLKSFIIKKEKSKKYKRYTREVDCLDFFKDNGNVIKLIDKGGKVAYQGNNYYYYVMELADITLKDLIMNGNHLNFEDKVSIFHQIINAFHTIHKQGYVHRDIKPQNILIKDNIIKIADFGIVYHKRFSRITRFKERVGPRDFICPESEDGRTNNIDSRCDIYALGKILYFLLSDGMTFSREEQKFENDEAYKLEVINNDDRFGVFLPFLRNAITYEAENRYSSIPEMKKDFRTCVEEFYNK